MDVSTQTKLTPIPARRWRRLLAATIGWIASLAVLATAGGVAVAYLWPIDDDAADGNRLYGRFVLLLFHARVFQMHLGLAALAGTLVVCATRRWRSSIACLIASAALLAPYARDYLPKRPPPPVSRTIRIMSINLFAMNRDATSILAAIEREDPDVVVACEVTRWSEGAVFAKLRDRYPRFVHPDYDGGAAVLSRVPFTVDRGPTLGNRRPLLFDIDGRQFAMYPVHLYSPGGRDHLFSNRFQTRRLAEIVARETRPVMVVGDCNFTQTTPQYAMLTRAGLRSTHDLVGFGVGNTWGPKWYPWLNRLPGVRIDQMLISRQLTATEHHVGPYTGSDHLPIVATVGFAQ